ncbi:MAG TPA: helix-turn-helix domain-containing protein [Candidatus Limnocylindria bacterium]|nr:helix-turn-helix domain-containing protein [Candidatus Limnocylindria bacterium]
MRDDDLKLIRALPLFMEMSEPHFASLMKAALFQRFPERVVLIEEGDNPDFLHVVVEGSVELFARHRGRETTIEIISPVTTFILAAVAQDDVYLKSARTLSTARILLIPAQSVRDMIGRDAAFARAMINELALRYRDIVRALKNEKLRSGSERLANWILRASDEQEHDHTIELKFEKRTLAARLGMTPENLSRALSHLSEHGVCTRGAKIEITDRPALVLFAAPSHLLDG